MPFVAGRLCPRTAGPPYISGLCIPISLVFLFSVWASRNKERVIPLDKRLRNLAWESVSEYEIVETVSSLLRGEQKRRER
jgi:hypothetical protein